MRTKWSIAVAAAGLTAMALPGIAIADPPAPPPAPPAPAPMTTMDHDGTYAVGTDIMAGTYSSAGPLDNNTCYWKRLSGPNSSDIIDNALSKKPQVVQIDPTDTAFKTSGCQPWLQTDPANADAATPGVLPALIAAAQLHTYIGTLNTNARQFDGEQLPQP